MTSFRKVFTTICLAAAIAVPMIATGCDHDRYYDAGYRDYHTWGPNEDVYYRQWLGERHYEYRDFRRWDKSHQRDYWQWRHAHEHDHDRH